MDKKRTLWIIMDLIFLIVFNVVFFVAGGTNHPLSVWLAYGFIHFSYIMLIVTPFFIRKSNAAVLGLSLYSISYFYFVLTFFVDLILIFVRAENYKPCLIINVILLGLYGIVLISNMLANESTIDSMERHEMELQYIKVCSAKLKGLQNTGNKDLDKKVEKAYDLIHSSQAKSNNSVRDYELTVIDLIDALEQNILKSDYVAADTTLDKILRNADERNRRLMYK